MGQRSGRKGPDPKPIEARFWPKVDTEGPCWLWTAAVHRHGYGKFADQGKTLLAHRVAWQLLVGPIPTGMELDHLCRVRACVNPDHLQVVTSKVNNRRSASPSAKHGRKTECPRGHAYNDANTYVRPGGERVCRTCHRDRAREAYRANAA